jgi:hypothetical protein
VSTRSKPGCFASRGEEDDGGRMFSSLRTTEEGRGCRAKGLRRGIVAVWWVLEGGDDVGYTGVLSGH